MEEVKPIVLEKKVFDQTDILKIPCLVFTEVQYAYQTIEKKVRCLRIALHLRTFRPGSYEKKMKLVVTQTFEFGYSDDPEIPYHPWKETHQS